MVMLKATLVFMLVLSALLTSTKVQADSWPKLLGKIDDPRCQQTLKAAEVAFRSPMAKLYEAAWQIQKQSDEFILSPKDFDEFVSDENYIESRRIEQDKLRALYIEKDSKKLWRFVVTQRSFNWQGDWYGLYLVHSSAMGEIADLLSKEVVTSSNSVKITLQENWQRPWLFYNMATQQIIAIDTQHPAIPLADWIVHAPNNGHVGTICRVRFHPEAKHVTQLLPKGPLRKLAFLLDDIIGTPSQGEGTLSPTARIQVDVETMWANLMFRPWVVPEPYNSRAEVEYGLWRWSKGHPVYRKQYERLPKLYTQAVKALAEYYQVTFEDPPEYAKDRAEKLLDIALRTHFKFSKIP